MVNYYLKRAVLKGGCNVAYNNNDLLDKSPNVKRRIAENYLNNIKHIRETMMQVLKRKLTDKETQYLREHSYNLSIHQVASEFQDNIGLSKDELAEMYQNLSDAELMAIFDNGLGEIMEDNK